MNNLILIYSFAILPLTIYAQKPVEGDKQVMLGLRSSNNAYLVLKHYYKEDMAKRYGIGGGQFNFSNKPGYVYNGIKSTSHSYNINMSLAYGIQKSIEGLEKIEPYLGVDYVLNVVLNNSYVKTEVVDSNGTVGSNLPMVGDYNFVKSHSESLTLNFRPLVGFNYYIKKNFAIGLEYSLNLFYIGYNFPSKHHLESKKYGSVTSTNNNIGLSYNVGSNFQDNIALTISYYFGNPSSKLSKTENQ